MPNYDILNFGIDWTGDIIEWGKKEAFKVLDMGPGKSYEEFIRKQSSKIEDMDDNMFIF